MTLQSKKISITNIDLNKSQNVLVASSANAASKGRRRSAAKRIKFWYTEKRARSILGDPRARHSIALFLTQGLRSVDMAHIRSTLARLNIAVVKVPTRLWSKSFTYPGLGGAPVHGETLCLSLMASPGSPGLAHGGVFPVNLANDATAAALSTTPLPWDILSQAPSGRSQEPSAQSQWMEWAQKANLTFAGLITAVADSDNGIWYNKTELNNQDFYLRGVPVKGPVMPICMLGFYRSKIEGNLLHQNPLLLPRW